MAIAKGTKKTLSIIVSTVEWAIFGVLLLTFLVVLSPLLPTKNFLSTYIVATGSMEPFIKTGSIALVKSVKPDMLKKGDVITFTSPKDTKQTIIHRITTVTKKNNLFVFRTKGDNNDAADSWTIPATSIKGKLVTTIPYLGHPAALLKTPRGFFLLVIIPALILAFFQLKKIKDGIEDEVQKRTKTALEQSKKLTPMNTLILILMLNCLALCTGSAVVQAVFVSTATARGVNFSVLDFIVPSIPGNLRFTDPDVSCGGTTNSISTLATWDSSTPHGVKSIAHYEYEFTPLSGTPVLTNVTGTSQHVSLEEGEGTYSYRVRSVDSLGYMSAWSNYCAITYTAPLPSDTIKPDSIITTGLNLDNDNESIKTHLHITKKFDWDGKIEGTASDTGGSGLKEVQLSIHRPVVDRYWNDIDWVSGSETSVRVVTTGLENWSYQLSNHPTGIYIITSHAVDNAGNMENSFVLVLNSEEVEVTPEPSPTVMPLTETPTPTITPSIPAPSDSTSPTISMDLSPDKKTISFTVENILGYSTADYSLTYTAYNTPRGIIGSGVDVAGQTQLSKTGLDLASCSNNICTYDQNISDVKLSVSLVNTAGTTVTIEKAL